MYQSWFMVSFNMVVISCPKSVSSKFKTRRNVMSITYLFKIICLNITKVFQLNSNNLPVGCYFATAPGFWTLPPVNLLRLFLISRINLNTGVFIQEITIFKGAYSKTFRKYNGTLGSSIWKLREMNASIQKDEEVIQINAYPT